MARKYGPAGTVGPARGFTWDEVRCTDGSLPGQRYLRKRFVKQAKNLNRLRGKVRDAYRHGKHVPRVTLVVNSWYRSPEYNAKIGGAKFSQHVACRATDIEIYVDKAQLHPAIVASLAKQVKAFARGGIGVYDRKHGFFTHVDHRADGPARWFNG